MRVDPNAFMNDAPDLDLSKSRMAQAGRMVINKEPQDTNTIQALPDLDLDP